jgi:hypothetical protein
VLVPDPQLSGRSGRRFAESETLDGGYCATRRLRQGVEIPHQTNYNDLDTSSASAFINDVQSIIVR